MANSSTEIDALTLTEPELLLIQACRRGIVCKLGEGLPLEGSSERTIRSEVLRYLILGGCEKYPVHQFGVRLRGAFIPDELDLSFCTAKGATVLSDCRFSEKFIALQTRFEFLLLSGSAMRGLYLEGSQVAGSVVLHDGFTSEGEVNLAATVIGGSLRCTGARLLNLENIALNAVGMRVTGSVHLNDGFSAEGTINFAGTTIGERLNCRAGRFYQKDGTALLLNRAEINGGVFLNEGFNATGWVNLSSASIAGQLDCVKGSFENEHRSAFTLSRARVSGAFYWYDVTVPSGLIDLNSARVGELVDDLLSWPEGEERLDIDGFIYDKVSPYFIYERLRWIQKGTQIHRRFKSQPYFQLSSVLRNMNDDDAARVVLIERERLLRKSYRKSQWQELKENPDSYFDNVLFVIPGNLFHLLWDMLYRGFDGYGYKPFRRIWLLVILVIVATFLGEMAWRSGAMVPNSDLILTSQDWQAIAHLTRPAVDWSARGSIGEDWETFDSVIWGVDVVVPGLDLGQLRSWSPSSVRGPWGVAALFGKWLLSIMGWIVVALVAAGFAAQKWRL